MNRKYSSNCQNPRDFIKFHSIHASSHFGPTNIVVNHGKLQTEPNALS